MITLTDAIDPGFCLKFIINKRYIIIIIVALHIPMFV